MKRTVWDLIMQYMIVPIENCTINGIRYMDYAEDWIDDVEVDWFDLHYDCNDELNCRLDMHYYEEEF